MESQAQSIKNMVLDKTMIV